MFFKIRSDRRRRQSYFPSQPVPACVQPLESRQLLTASLINSLPDVRPVQAGTEIDPGQYFDDPAIAGSVVQMSTVSGTFFVETFDQITPLTAGNFLDLVAGGNYDDMFIHRSSPGFVVQGGGFRWPQAGDVSSVVNAGNIVNEFTNWHDPALGGLDDGAPVNLRGTIATAKLADDPDSANSQWFVNLADNSANLDDQNGGFTVFAQVLFDGMDVVDAIAALPRVNAGQPFDNLPVVDFDSAGAVQRGNVLTSSLTRVSELSYEVTSDNPSVVAVSLIDGKVVLSPASGKRGVAQITVTATDLQGNSVSDQFSVVAEVPETPQVIGPSDTLNARPEFIWNSVDGADSYELYVERAGQRGVIHERNVSDTRFQPVEDLADSIYRIWVRSKNQAGVSVWSNVSTVAVGVVKPENVSITSPSENVGQARPSIEWTRAAGAAEYRVWVSRIGGASGFIQETVATTSFTSSEDLADGTYRVWVQPLNSNFVGNWSSAVTFQIFTGPTLTAPGEQDQPRRPLFTWDSDEVNGVFELWVNQVGGAPRVIHRSDLTGTSFAADSDLLAGDYRAWIRLRSGEGSAWSPALSFSVTSTPAVVETLDVTLTEASRPHFDWNDVSNGTRYELWINQVGGVVRIIHLTTLSVSEYQAASDLSAGTYRVWLRAFNANDVAGVWSSLFLFEIA